MVGDDDDRLEPGAAASSPSRTGSSCSSSLRPQARASVYRPDEVFAAAPDTVRRGQGGDPARTRTTGRPGPRPAFSATQPPSVAEHLQGLEADLGISPPDHCRLDAWARQGVLLLNASLTVRDAASHQGRAGDLHRRGAARRQRQAGAGRVHPLGASARRKKALIDTSRHVVIESAHPSPLSASNGFFGSRPFSRANALVEAGRSRSTGRCRPATRLVAPAQVGGRGPGLEAVPALGPGPVHCSGRPGGQFTPPGIAQLEDDALTARQHLAARRPG